MLDSSTRQFPCLVRVELSCTGETILIKSVHANGHSSAAIDVRGRLFTWGSTAYGRLMHPEHSLENIRHNRLQHLQNESQHSLSQTATSPETNDNRPTLGTIDGRTVETVHLCRPVVVDELLSNVVCDFTFSKTSSAVMLLSQLTGVSDLVLLISISQIIDVDKSVAVLVVALYRTPEVVRNADHSWHWLLGFEGCNCEIYQQGLSVYRSSVVSRLCTRPRHDYL